MARLLSLALLSLPAVHSLLVSAGVARRELIAATAAALLAAAPLPPAHAGMSAEEADALDLKSRTAEGVALPSGVRVIDVMEGDGPLPSKGDRVCASHLARRISPRSHLICYLHNVKLSRSISSPAAFLSLPPSLVRFLSIPVPPSDSVPVTKVLPRPCLLPVPL